MFSSEFLKNHWRLVAGDLGLIGLTGLAAVNSAPLGVVLLSSLTAATVGAAIGLTAGVSIAEKEQSLPKLKPQPISMTRPS